MLILIILDDYDCGHSDDHHDHDADDDEDEVVLST